MGDPNADYLRNAMPVLVTYTQQVVFALDVDRMRRALALHGGTPAETAFLDALATFRQSVAGLDLEGITLP